MIVCFDWPETRRKPGSIYFFPFVPATNVKRRVLSAKHKTDAGRAMAEYHGMLSLPHQILMPANA